MSLQFVTFGEGTIKKGNFYPTRKSGHCELIILKSGSLNICEGYREYRMEAGDVLILDGKEGHYGNRPCIDDSSFDRLIFNGDLSKFISDNGYDVTLRIRQLSPAHPERFQSVIQMITKYTAIPEYPDSYLNRLLELIIAELFIDGIPCYGKLPDKIALSSAVCDFICEKNGILHTKELEKQFGYTAKYLSALFTARYSKGIKQYIDQVRLSYLKIQLSSDKTPAEASACAGFKNIKSMQDFFRYNTGTTVSEWMVNLKNDQ